MFSQITKTKLRKLLDQKIKVFEGHPGYDWLKTYAETAKQYMDMHDKNGEEAMDFIIRIIVMPENYIRGFLQKENKLEWSADIGRNTINDYLETA